MYNTNFKINIINIVQQIKKWCLNKKAGLETAPEEIFQNRLPVFGIFK